MAKKFSTIAPKTRAALLAVLISTLLLAIFAAASCKNSGGLFGKGARASAGAAAGSSDSEFGENGGLSPIPQSLDARFVSIETAVGEIETAEIPADVDAGIFDTLRAELVRQLRERADEYGGRLPAAAPVGDAGRVTDLGYDAETNMLSWSYVNKGDYDLSGDVGIPDITPIALNYLKLVEYDEDGNPAGDIETIDGYENHRLAWIDGDKSGEIGIPDITTIALNYLRDVLGYRLFRSPDGEGDWQEFGSFVNYGVRGDFPKRYSTNLPQGALDFVIVRPIDKSGSPGEHSNFASIPGNIPPIADLSANPESGPAPLNVAFDASASNDPDGGNIIKFVWDWTNDGAYDYDSGSNPHVYNTYYDSGVYVCKIRVIDNRGAQGTATVSIEVSGSGGDEWIHTWGGSRRDYINGVSVDSNGNVYLAGRTDSFGAGDKDAFLLKYSAYGNLLWQKTWGGVGDDEANCVSVDSNGNVYVTGRTKSFGAGNWVVFLLKYSASGNLVWQKTWGGSYTDYPYSISVDSSGNVYVTGWSESFGAGGADAFLLKYSDSGNLVWQKTWGGSGRDYAHDVTVDSSGNVYLAGNTYVYGEGGYDDAFLLKYSSTGNLIWQKIWGGSGFDWAHDVSVDSNGNVYVTGSTYSFGAGESDAFLLKYSSSGNLDWQKTWGGIFHEFAFGVNLDSSGNVYVAGATVSFGTGGYDAFLLKYSSSGNLVWQKTWGGSGSDSAQGVRVDSHGNIYIGGCAQNIYGSWNTPPGTETTPNGTETTPNGTETAPDGTETTPNGTETSPVGVEDEGGGGDDALVMKIAPQ